MNSGVLGTVLVERTQSFTLAQSIGFGLGSGLGYLLAVMLVTEAGNRLRSKAIPEAFRGLPITLIYIGVLALAIYGFTGHSVILGHPHLVYRGAGSRPFRIQCRQRECILRDAEHRCQRTGSFLGAGKRAGARGQGH